MSGFFNRRQIKVRKTYFHPLFVEWSIDIEFETTEREFDMIMAWEKCGWNEEMGCWYTPDDSACYEIIG